MQGASILGVRPIERIDGLHLAVQRGSNRSEEEKKESRFHQAIH